MGIPLYVICCFPLLLLVFFLCIYSLTIWLIWVLACFFLDLSCMGLSVLPGLNYFFSHISEVFNYNLFKYFLSPFLFLFLFWDPYNSNVCAFNVVSEVSKTVLNSFLSFFFIMPWSSYFQCISCQDTYMQSLLFAGGNFSLC